MAIREEKRRFRKVKRTVTFVDIKARSQRTAQRYLIGTVAAYLPWVAQVFDFDAFFETMTQEQMGAVYPLLPELTKRTQQEQPLGKLRHKIRLFIATTDDPLWAIGDLFKPGNVGVRAYNYMQAFQYEPAKPVELAEEVKSLFPETYAKIKRRVQKLTLYRGHYRRVRAWVAVGSGPRTATGFEIEPKDGRIYPDQHITFVSKVLKLPPTGIVGAVVVIRDAFYYAFIEKEPVSYKVAQENVARMYQFARLYRRVTQEPQDQYKFGGLVEINLEKDAKPLKAESWEEFAIFAWALETYLDIVANQGRPTTVKKLLRELYDEDEGVNFYLLDEIFRTVLTYVVYSARTAELVELHRGMTSVIDFVFVFVPYNYYRGLVEQWIFGVKERREDIWAERKESVNIESEAATEELALKQEFIRSLIGGAHGQEKKG